MFKTLSGLTDNVFLRVSADTKTCGSPLYLSSPQGKGQATGGLCLPVVKHAGILTYCQTKVNKKTAENPIFFRTFYIWHLLFFPPFTLDSLPAWSIIYRKTPAPLSRELQRIACLSFPRRRESRRDTRYELKGGNCGAGSVFLKSIL